MGSRGRGGWVRSPGVMGSRCGGVRGVGISRGLGGGGGRGWVGGGV